MTGKKAGNDGRERRNRQKSGGPRRVARNNAWQKGNYLSSFAQKSTVLLLSVKELTAAS